MISSNVFQGISASKGIAIAKAFVFSERTFEISNNKKVDIEQEISRFHHALQHSLEDLKQIYEQTKKELGEDKAQIFEAHMLILEDPELINPVTEKIRTAAINAESALEQVIAEFIKLFESMGNEYMKERAVDIRDVSQRVLAHLIGISYQPMNSFEEDVIIIAHDLTPSDTAQMDRQHVKGFATNIGGTTSHSAIMARSMEIPAVVGVKEITKFVKNDDIIIVDGLEGQVIINPSPEEIKQYELKRKNEIKSKEKLAEFVNQPTVTADGRQVEIGANIGTPDDLQEVIQNGAEGIGLFRSEFLYLNRKNLPNEEEQFLAYKKVVEGMNDKPVIIRTLDIGGDKELPYLSLSKEMNPFLGYRAIRFCLDQPEIFKTQLRAILRASNYGNVKIMYPMIATISEIRQANQILAQVKKQLIEENISFAQDIEVGIMVEIPASALAADVLVKEVDFFSIGTNDLIQYTMAADRMNEKVSYLYQPYHPAILRLIKIVIDAAHQEGKWVGMCGEMAGDMIAVPILLGLGLDEFSMTSSSILSVRRLINRLEYSQMKKLALEAMKLDSQENIRSFVKLQIESKGEM